MNAPTELSASPDARFTQAKTRVADLRQLLIEEYQLLGAGNIDGFTDLLSSKQRLLEELGGTNSGELMQAFAGTHAWQAFIDDLDDCRRRNLVNGAAMTEILKARSEAFRSLLGHPGDRSDAYQADGRIASDGASRQLGSA